MTLIKNSLFGIALFSLCAALSSPLLLAAPTKRKPPPPPPLEDTVELDKLIVGAYTYQWFYAKSDHFEILTSIGDNDLAARIIQKAEQIISLFESRGPVFTLKNELPTKVIIFSNQGVERFMEESRQNLDVSDRAGYSSDGTQSDPIPVGLWMRDSSYSDGYAMIAVPISEAYLNSNLPAEIKTNEYAYALASAYFGVCFDSHHYKPAFPEHFSRTVSFLRDPTVV